MADLPLILAGPLLRRVDSGNVCVWMALSSPGTVTVHVFSGRQTSTGDGTSTGPSLGSNMRGTRQFGAKLHVVAVDVPAGGMAPGTRCSYDVVVEANAQTKGLKALGLLKDGTGTPKPLALGYGTDVLPSFVTPAASVADLRLVHTSCRKSNGPGPDALAWLDDRIQDGLSNQDEAPQQLFLTGDQIYADDVGGVLLPMLSDLAKDLVGPEKLPVAGAMLDADYTRFPALRRQGTIRALAQMTSEDAASHLLTFGEFAAMYCAAFSPTVWRDLPTPESLFVDPPADAGLTKLTDHEACHGTRDKWKDAKLKGVTDEAANVKKWRDAVPKVARALANVATYMICDDHEVTDDWNISPRWRSRVVVAPFGRAVLRNAIMAYAVFQAWGNDPVKFRHDGNVTPDQVHANEKLLDAVTKLTGSLANPEASTFDTIDGLIGLDKPMADSKIEFHFEVSGTAHQVRVLDTRTKRGYRGAGNSPPKLLGGSLDKQIPKGPFTDGRDLLVVVSASPVLFPTLFDKLAQPAAATIFDLKTHMFGREDPDDPCKIPGLVGTEVYDVEGWAADEQAREELFRRLGTYPRVVVLSGDVHFASTLTLDFWGKDDDTRDSRIVQCTASSARNQPEGAKRGILRTLRIGQQLIRGVPVEQIAWEGAPGVALPSGASIRPGRRARMLRKPALLPAAGWPAGTTSNSRPDWRWRLEVIRDERPKAQLPAGAPNVPVLTWNDGDKIASYAAIAGSHQQIALDPKDPLRLLVFRNNIGLVSFAADGSDFKVSHTLLSTADDDTGDEFTEHTVRFVPSPVPPAPVLGTV